ncbi:battenin isoform X2 [Diachasmimorpha longicaudata]|uniref:battenin isoform X2 n=1 Tax=Diachasmimorpha longicaudata TaxID=58733 RepID=UPI0030B8DF37
MATEDIAITSHPNDNEFNNMDSSSTGKRWRNLLAFWMLGLCNNYGYVVVLTAAHDILVSKFGSNDHDKTNSSITNTTIDSRGCNAVSTGAILLADIVPCLLVKLMVPFLPFFVHIRMATCVLCSIAGFLAVSLGESQWITVFGVILTSISSGLGEVSIVSYSHKFGKESIASWSSGTGGAGIIGAFSYTGLTMIMSSENALLAMLIVPVIQAIAFWLLMVHPEERPIVKYGIDSQEEIVKMPKKSIPEKFQLLPKLLVYLIPLTLVYFFEYFINMGLYELIQFDGIWLSHSEQYRWLQVDYQIGVFISRSSATFITFKKVWLMAILQGLNVILFSTEAIFFFIPNIWIIFVVTFWEGLLGGGAYVNTFYSMVQTIPAEDLKDSLGIVTMADSLGITLAGWTAMEAHSAICKLPRPIR